MKQMSLADICKEYGISRRTIQGYEKSGLVKATNKTKYGYLLYDEEMIYRILFIKYCQNIGFKLKEIADFIDSSKEEIKEKIVSKLPDLESNIELTTVLINDSKRIIKLLNKDNSKKLIYQITKKGKLK